MISVLNMPIKAIISNTDFTEFELSLKSDMDEEVRVESNCGCLKVNSKIFEFVYLRKGLVTNVKCKLDNKFCSNGCIKVISIKKNGINIFNVRVEFIK